MDSVLLITIITLLAAYLILGMVVMYATARFLLDWMADAPNVFLFIIVFMLWPLMLLYFFLGSWYFALKRELRRRKNEK